MYSPLRNLAAKAPRTLLNNLFEQSQYFQKFSSTNSGKCIVPFSSEHKAAVKKIAMENLKYLVSDARINSLKDFEAYVKPAITESTCLVSLEEGKPVAFITYGSRAKF